MNHRSVRRVGRLLCGFASVLMLGLLAAPASAQSDSPVTFTIGEYCAFEFLGSGPIAIVVSDGGTLGSYEGTRIFQIVANTNWAFGSFTFSDWVPGPPLFLIGASGVPGGGVPGITLGTLTVTISDLTFPTPPQVKTGILTVTISCI